MTDSHSTYGSRFATRGLTPRLNALGRLLATHVVPPLVVLRELAKYAGKIFPETWNKFLFRRFWGEGTLSSDAYFVIDSYEDVRLRSGFRRAEAFAAGKQPKIFADGEIIHGTFSPQAATMLVALFLRHAGRAPRIATDTEVGPIQDATLICYGTSDSNFKTFEIEASCRADLCRFSFDAIGQRAFRVGGKLYSAENRCGVTYDKAILLRLISRQDSSHSHVVCAGLSEWGSLAAVTTSHKSGRFSISVLTALDSEGTSASCSKFRSDSLRTHEKSPLRFGGSLRPRADRLGCCSPAARDRYKY